MTEIELMISNVVDAAKNEQIAYCVGASHVIARETRVKAEGAIREAFEGLMLHDKELDREAGQMRAFWVKLNKWLGDNPNWDLAYEPPWYQEMRALMGLVE